MKFRKKPVIIDAVQFTQEMTLDKNLLPDGVFKADTLIFEGQTGVSIEAGDHYVVTIHNQATLVVVGDWIITEPDGVHYYPCKPDIFANIYDPVGNEKDRTLASIERELRILRQGVEIREKFEQDGLAHEDCPCYTNGEQCFCGAREIVRSLRHLDDLDLELQWGKEHFPKAKAFRQRKLPFNPNKFEYMESYTPAGLMTKEDPSWQMIFLETVARDESTREPTQLHFYQRPRK